MKLEQDGRWYEVGDHLGNGRQTIFNRFGIFFLKFCSSCLPCCIFCFLDFLLPLVDSKICISKHERRLVKGTYHRVCVVETASQRTVIRIIHTSISLSATIACSTRIRLHILIQTFLLHMHVGSSLRDLLGCKYKSSTKAKRIRRKEVTVQMSDDVDALIMTNVNVARRMKRLAEDISRGGTYCEVLFSVVAWSFCIRYEGVSNLGSVLLANRT